MPTAITERYRTITGNESGMAFGFLVEGATNEYDAIQATRTHCGELYPPRDNTDDAEWTNRNQSMYLTDVSIEEVTKSDPIDTPVDDLADTNSFLTVANYSFRAVCPIVSSDFGTEGTRITDSIETRIAFDANGDELDPAPYERQIEVELETSNRRVKGTTRRTATGRYTMRWNPPAIVTAFGSGSQQGVDGLYDISTHQMLGTVNNSTFYGNPPGTMLFSGYSSKLIDQRNGLWECVYTFDYRPNQLGVTLGGTSGTPQITIPYVFGWDHVWVARKKKAKNGKQIPHILNVNVEQIYPAGEHNDLFKLLLTATPDPPDNSDPEIPAGTGGYTFTYGNSMIDRCPYFGQVN